MYKWVCIPVHLINPIKACFSNKKIKPARHKCQIESRISFMQKTYLNVFFLNIIGVQNQLPVTFDRALVCNKTLQVRNSLYVEY